MLRKVLCLIALLVILPTFTANAASELSSFSVFATNSVWVRQGADVNSGNIGVADANPGPWLASQSEVTVGKNVSVADGDSIYGDSIKVKTGASAFDVYYNELTNNGTIRGSKQTPLVLPLDITMPEFPTPTPGTEDHDIPQGGSLTLTPGSYGEIMVRKNATLTLTGGTYHFENLDLGNLNAKVLFQTPTDLIINNRLGPGKSAFIGPEDGSGISAKDIHIYVNGINGGTGNLGATPKAAQIGETNTLQANIYAPNGTLLLKQGTVAEGAFIGKDVKIGQNVQVTLNSGFGGAGQGDDLDGDGFTVNQGDCDNNNAAINPAALEACDGVDNNCDGQIDEDVKTTYYEDSDNDGYGNPNVTTDDCEQPTGYVTDNTDCDDANNAVNPGAAEIPNNSIDDDCDASTPDTGVVLPPDPGEDGKLTLLGIDSDGDGVRDDIQRYIYFTYPDDEKLRLGLTFYAKEFQGVLADAGDREASYNHAIKMARHGECLNYLKGRESINIRRALRAEILNTSERSIAYITYSDNLGGKIIRMSPLDEWKDSCSFDVDASGGDQ